METVVLEPDGRVRLPERALAQLGLAEGDQLTVEVRDGRVVLERPRARPHLVRAGPALVVSGGGPWSGDPLEEAREERDDAVAGGLLAGDETEEEALAALRLAQEGWGPGAGLEELVALRA